MADPKKQPAILTNIFDFENFLLMKFILIYYFVEREEKQERARCRQFRPRGGANGPDDGPGRPRWFGQVHRFGNIWRL